MATPKEIKLLGFNLIKIEAERKQDFKGKLEIKTNIDIKKIEKHKLDLSKQESLKIEFVFEINYGDLGKVSLGGTLFMLPDPKSMKQILNGWKEKNLDSNLQVFILNVIVQRASLKAFQIEEELGLPIHIQLPRLKVKE